MSKPPSAKWWGWGWEGKTYDLANRPDFWPYLTDRLGLANQPACPRVDLETIRLPTARLDDGILSGLAAIVGAANVYSDDYARLTHAMGKSYRDLVRIRRGYVPHPPDAVVFPADTQQVEAVLELADCERLAVVPFGGGSSVVGGVEGLAGSCHAVICLDTARLKRVLGVDDTSRTVRVQAGISGPALEDDLNRRGYTLGHYPQSFEFSCLGGWIATRSAGHASTFYGKIEDMVESLRLDTPTGPVEILPVPASAAGPDLKQLIIGSEGVLGVITEATLRVQLLPAAMEYQAFMFHSFGDGLACVRQLMQQDVTPATVRLSDAAETEMLFKLLEHKPGASPDLKTRLGQWLLARGGYRLGAACFMILGYEGNREHVRAQWARASAVCKQHNAFGLGHGPAYTWRRDRYELPYLRDVLLDRGVLVDTLETATTWDNLASLHGKLLVAIAEATTKTGSPPLVMAHVSHAYPDGASLYFTFLARQSVGWEIEQWETIKRAASECIVVNRGTITHHHGVGYEHMPWLLAEHGRQWLAALRVVKAAWDPHGIMNPGKLLPDEEG